MSLTTDDIRERAAKVLGWTFTETCQFSLLMLREMVRGKDDKLAQEISDLVQSGQHIFGERIPNRRW